MPDRREKVTQAATAAKERVEAKLGDIWWAILLRGLLAVVLAVCAFVWPEKTLGLFVKLLGAYFLIDGVIGAISAFRSGEKASPVIQAIVSLAIGLILLVWTGVSGKLFLILFGIWLVLQGVSLFVAAFRMDSVEGQRGLTMLIGGAAALIGAVFIFWPDTGVTAISWLVGIGSAIIGALLIYLATRVRGVQKKLDGLGKPTD